MSHTWVYIEFINNAICNHRIFCLKLFCTFQKFLDDYRQPLLTLCSFIYFDFNDFYPLVKIQKRFFKGSIVLRIIKVKCIRLPFWGYVIFTEKLSGLEINLKLQLPWKESQSTFYFAVLMYHNRVNLCNFLR